MSGETFRAPRGASDLLPERAELWGLIEAHAIEVFERYGYRPLVTPVFEQTELFRRGIGESTDIVQKEMYTFEDRSGRSLTLRPEGTAPVVRSYLEHHMSGWPQPVKLYYAGPMFRYERPQAGRYRQFWQLGIELIGSAEAAADAEVVLLLYDFLSGLGLTGLTTEINSMGCPECRPGYVKALREALGAAPELCGECRARLATNPLRVFDCKKESCQAALTQAPKIGDSWCGPCRENFQEVRELLTSAGLSFTVRSSLVRGFDYYTRTTFEVTSGDLGAQNALGGGGRYDGLVELYGGPPTPGIGFAVGTDRVALVLEQHRLVPPGAKTRSVVAVVAVDESGRGAAFQVAERLRRAGRCAELDLVGRSLKAQMKNADRLGAVAVIIVGPEEEKRGVVRVRDMASGSEQEVRIDGLEAWAAGSV